MDTYDFYLFLWFLIFNFLVLLRNHYLFLGVKLFFLLLLIILIILFHFFLF